MGKSSGGDTQTSTTTTEVPDWIRNLALDYHAWGRQLTQPFMSYTPQNTVAGFNPDQTFGFELTRDMAQNAFQADPTSVPDASYSPATIGASTFAAPTMGQAPGMDAASYGPATMQAATVPLSTGYDPSAYDATLGRAARSNFDVQGNLGNADQMQAAGGVAAQLGGRDYRRFMNPFIEDVVDATTAQAREQYDRTIADIGARSAAAGAFGGSREALSRMQAAEDFDRNLQSTVADLMMRGFDAATANALANAQMRQQTQTMNAGFRQEANAANMAANNQFSQLQAQLGLQQALQNAGFRQQMGLENMGAQNAAARYAADAQNSMLSQLLGLTSQEGLAQAGYDQAAAAQNAQMAQQAVSEGAGFEQQANQLNTQLQYQRMLENLQSQLQTRQANQDAMMAARLANQGAWNTSRQFNATNDLEEARLQDQFTATYQQRQMDALRQLLGIGGLQQDVANQSLNVPFNMLQLYGGTIPTNAMGAGTTTSTQPDNSPSWWQQLLGFGAATAPTWGPALFGLLSDENEKTDKRKLGRDPDTGLTMYAYRYKGDPKSYPKVIGPMAQEAERRYPGSTRRVGGNLGMLMAA